MKFFNASNARTQRGFGGKVRITEGITTLSGETEKYLHKNVTAAVGSDCSIRHSSTTRT
jgi:hypothetical protein